MIHEVPMVNIGDVPTLGAKVLSANPRRSSQHRQCEQRRRDPPLYACYVALYRGWWGHWLSSTIRFDMFWSALVVHPLEKFSEISRMLFSFKTRIQLHQSLGGKGPPKRSVSQSLKNCLFNTLMHLAGASPKTRPQQKCIRSKQPHKKIATKNDCQNT